MLVSKTSLVFKQALFARSKRNIRTSNAPVRFTMMGSKQAIRHEVAHLEQGGADHLVEAFLVKNLLGKLDRRDRHDFLACADLSAYALVQTETKTRPGD